MFHIEGRPKRWPAPQVPRQDVEIAAIERAFFEVLIVDLQLFRAEVSKKNSPFWLGPVGVAIAVSRRVWTVAASLIAVAMVSWPILVHRLRNENATGSPLPQAGLIGVISNPMGVACRLFVAQGDLVHAGEPLVTSSVES